MGGMETAGPSRAEWRKSSRSTGNGGACVETAAMREAVAIRDSKDSDGPALTVRAACWRTFVAGVKDGSSTAPDPAPRSVHSAGRGGQASPQRAFRAAL